jgi:hypothetical protein
MTTPTETVAYTALYAVDRLEDRVNGEAEARSYLAGQFHETISELVDFAVEAHVAITISEANIDVLTKNLERLTDLFHQSLTISDERFVAQRTAIQAVWEATKTRPSRWSRLFG